MVLQYTYLARALLCAWVAEGHDFAIQSHVNLHAKLQRERAPTIQVRQPKVSLHLSLGSTRFVQQAQSSLSVPDNFMGEKNPKRWSRFLPIPVLECLAYGAIKFP